MMTVDWSPWLTLSAEEQAALWRRYRQIVKQESEQAKASYRTANAATKKVRA